MKNQITFSFWKGFVFLLIPKTRKMNLHHH